MTECQWRVPNPRKEGGLMKCRRAAYTHWPRMGTVYGTLAVCDDHRDALNLFFHDIKPWR